MHYANGQPAKAGDLVIRREFYKQGEKETGNEVIGVITGGQSQSTSCNGYLIVFYAADENGTRLRTMDACFAGESMDSDAEPMPAHRAKRVVCDKARSLKIF
jgi:hypothetical protein